MRQLIRDLEPTAIFRPGARTDLRGTGADDYQANTDGVRNVIAAALDLAPSPKTIFASNRLVCRIDNRPRPETDCCPIMQYGESKVAGERIVPRRPMATSSG